MSRFPTFAQTIEDCLHFKISCLNKWGHLKLNHSFYRATMTWSIDGEKIAEINYSINSIDAKRKILTFNYNASKEPVSYDVELIAIETNLKNGLRWYFICPETGKRCLDLIKPNGCNYFYHRSAFNLLYESQKRSKKTREFDIQFNDFFKVDDLVLELYEKYRKTHYRGKPTPLVKKILKMRENIGCREKMVRAYGRALLS